VEGKGNCYLVPSMATTGPAGMWRFDQIVARDDGDLFIHSGSQLVRVTYPQ
jgi:hypothetical protein